jgi:hypothetical protein
VKRDPPTRSIFGVGAFGSSINRGASTGGANQRFLVSVCRDQDERLRRPVFLNPPTSHGRPFRWGLVAWNWLPPPSDNLGKNMVSRKAGTPRE